MEQYSKGYHIYKTPLLPFRLKTELPRRDEFVKELIELWESRNYKGDVYTAYSHLHPVGILLVQEMPLTIRGFWVDSAYRGEGIGTQLMNELIKNAGSQEIRVNVTDGAQKFYEKFGFEIGERREDFPDQFRAVRKVKNERT